MASVRIPRDHFAIIVFPAYQRTVLARTRGRNAAVPARAKCYAMEEQNREMFARSVQLSMIHACETATAVMPIERPSATGRNRNASRAGRMANDVVVVALVVPVNARGRKNARNDARSRSTKVQFSKCLLRQCRSTGRQGDCGAFPPRYNRLTGVSTGRT